MIKYKPLVYLAVIFFTSCNETQNETEKNEYEIRSYKQERLDSLNESQAINLSKQLNAITNKDSTLKFTYQIQELVKRNNTPISVIGYIKHIILKDSSYILKIHGTFGIEEYFGEILISSGQFHELNKQLYPKSSYNQGCFIFRPTTIKSSSMLKINSEVSTDSDAETADEANTNASS